MSSTSNWIGTDLYKIEYGKYIQRKSGRDSDVRKELGDENYDEKNLPLDKYYNSPKFISILRALYEAGKAFFVKVEETPWYRSNEVCISKDVPFDEGMTTAGIIVYAITGRVGQECKRIFDEIQEQMRLLQKEAETEKAKKLEEILAKAGCFSPSGTSGEDPKPSAPPREQVEGETSA